MELKNIKILIIDDVKDNLITLSALIRESFVSAKIFSATKGIDGIEIAKHEDVDLILLDVLMPGMDGYKVCKVLKEDPKTEDIPVVFVTALRDHSENKIKALEVGADAFISKPIDEVELIAQIRAMVKIKKAAKDKKDEAIRLQKLVDEKTKELTIQIENSKKLYENLDVEYQKRVQSEQEMKKKEQENQFLYSTSSELMMLSSIDEVYAYTTKKLYDLLEKEAIVCLVDYNMSQNLWKLKQIEGVNEYYSSLSKIFGFDLMELHGEIQTAYFDKINSGDLVEIMADFQSLFNNKVSPRIAKAVLKLIQFDSIYCISFKQNDHIFGNITIIPKNRARLINKNLIKSFVQQVTNYIRKQTFEDALRVSESKYRALFNNMFDGFAIHEIICDDKGEPIDYRFLDVNKSFEKITGLKATDVIGKRVLEVLPNTEKYWIQNYGQVALTGKPMSYQNYAAELDKYFEVSAFSPAPNQFACLFVDQTNRKKSEEQILRNTSMLQGMVRVFQYQSTSIQDFLDYTLNEAIKLTGSKIGYIFLYDEQKQEFEINTWSENIMEFCAIKDLFKAYHLDEAGFWADVVRDRESKVYNYFDEVQKSGSAFPKGHIEIHNFMTIPVFVADKIVAVVGFANKDGEYDNDDLLQIQLLMDGVWKEVERKKVELSLQKNDERYKTFFNANEDFIFLKDENFRYIIANDSIASFFNTTKEEMFGKTDDELASDELIAPCKSSDLKVIDTKSTFRIEEKLGNRFFETTKFPVFLDGDKIGVGGIIRDVSDQKKAEERERFIAGITAAVSDAIVATDLDFKITYINERAEELYGYTLDEVLGKNTRVVYAAENLVELEKHIREIVSKGGKYVGEFLHRRKDGSTFMAEMKAQPMYDDKHNIVTYIGILRDITDQKEYEYQLLEKETQYRNLANSGLALIWTAGTNKLCNYFNEPWLDFTGRTLEQELGNGWLEGVHPDDMASCMEVYTTSFDKRVSFDMEYRMRHRSGEYKWIRDLGSPIYNTNNEFIGYIGHCFDMTERKKNELVQQIQLKIAQSIQGVTDLTSLLEVIHVELSKIFNTDNFFVALYEEERDVMVNLINKDELDYLNEWPAKDSLSGYVAKTGKSIFMRQDEIEKLTNELNMEPIGSDSQVWLGVPINIPNKSRGAMVIQDYHDPDAFTPSDLILLEMIAHETEVFIERKQILDELVRAKEKAEESDRLKSAFLANMSHEIRTPMNGILGFSSLLKEPGLTGDQQMEYINIIEKSGARMLNIINDIIDISKIESGLMKVDWGISNINEQIDFVYNFFKPEALSRDIHLKISNPLPTHKAYVRTDREKLFAILINLVKNALKFTVSGSIHFGYEVKENTIEFYVKDTGIGIPKDRISAIFERFIQAEIVDVMARQGAGLGLAITKAYVEMLGGTIWAESEEGVGSQFFFTIPYILGEYDSDPFTESQELKFLYQHAESPKLNILIAEDDEISSLVLNKALKDYIKTFYRAKTGPEVLEYFNQHPEVDLIFMDINLPEMNGYEVTKEIRKTNQDVIIIAQTAYDLSSDKEMALTSGCNDYISKPTKKNDLIDLIKKYF
ncbi:MAG TPA: PAS domain S-box protein [Bacteroidales bacterium]|nr:PAS domain S-box protein [Bacteroidales bacterium]